MTPKGATGRTTTCHYYCCSRQNHQAGKVECSSLGIPAEALEAAVIRLLRRIATCRDFREQIVNHALAALGEDFQRVQEEAVLVRQRLSAVQAEINNLLGVLAKMGAEEAGLVEEGLVRLKSEREQLQGKLKELDSVKAPHDAVRDQARKFVESWTDVGQLLDEADLPEQMIILQHFVQALELKAADAAAKKGTYVLRIFPELGPLNEEPPQNGHDPMPGGSGNRVVLTENGVVLHRTGSRLGGGSRAKLTQHRHRAWPRVASRTLPLTRNGRGERDAIAADWRRSRPSRVVLRPRPLATLPGHGQRESL